MLKLATILFADVVSSTERAEQMHPEDVRALMGAFFEAMAGEIRAEGGTIEKFVGDAIMAVFGVPTAHEDDPVRAVRAALRMLARLERWNAEQEPGSRLAIRIGVNTGEVLAAGSPGSDLLVTGDPVNLAARLEQAADPGGVVVGRRTAVAVGAVFDLRELEPLELRGKAEPVAAWKVEGERADTTLRGIPGLAAPLVGRESELEITRAILERVEREGSPHVVTVVGEAGVGKSRLVREVVSAVDERARVLVGRCLPYGEGVTLWPLGEILRAEAGILDTDSPADAASKVGALVARVVPRDVAPEPERTTAALASTIALEREADALAHLDARARYRELLAAWRALVASLAAERLVVVVVEDIHWADETMLDVLDELAERVEGPVLFVCTTRPELLRARPGWGGGRRNFSSLPLDPLTAGESAVLVSHLLAADELPATLRQRILERSEGNPFFLEEIVRRLIDEDRLVRANGRWRAAAGVEDVELPDTVQAVILARIDLLAPPEKEIIQRAAVLGRAFWAGAVAHLVRGEPVEEALRELVRREFVHERLSSSMAGEREYAFKHVLVRDVAYETLPRKARGLAHAAAAEWIEARAGERADELAELLAHHHRLAFELLRDDEQRRRARDRYAGAARAAIRRFALRQGEGLAREAVELSSPGRERVEALEALGDLYYTVFRGDDAWRAYLQAAEEADPADPDQRRALARVCANAAMLGARWVGVMWANPSEAETLAVIDRGLEAAGAGASRERALLLAAQGHFAETFGRGDAEEAANQALAAAEAIGDADVVSAALDAVANVFVGEMGDHARSHRVNERRLSLVPSMRDVGEIADAYAMAAWSSLSLGRYRDAVVHATACVERSRGVVPGTYLHGLAWRVWARAMVGDWEGALDDQAEVEAIVAQDPADDPVPYSQRAHAAAAFVRELRGEQDRADSYFELLRRIRTRSRLGFALAVRALVHRGLLAEARRFLVLDVPATRSAHLEAACELVALEEDWAEGVQIASLAREEAERAGLAALPLFADRLEGRAAAAAGETERAATLLRRSAEGFARLEAPWEEAWSRLLLGETLAAAGRGSDADVADALSVFERLRSPREADRARTLLEGA